MAGDDETPLFATGHVEAKLLFGRQSEELTSEAIHVGNESGVDAMIDDLENTPVLASLDDFLADLGASAINFVNPRERNDRNVVAELVVCDFWALIFVTDEGRLKGLLVR